MKTLRIIGLVSCFALLFFGCNTQDKPVASSSTLLATFEGGSVSPQDIDQAIMALNPAERVVTKEERLGWYERLAQDIAISKLLIDEANQKATLDDPQYQQLAHQAARTVQTNAYLALNLTPIQVPSQTELEKLFEDIYKDGLRRGRAIVSNIFIRYTDTKDKAAVQQELIALKQRILNGENFGQLATAHSDSETRHRAGALGSLNKDQLPPALQEVIFSLKENQPSDPIFTKDGGHLFMAENIIPEKTFTVDEVRQQLMIAYQSKQYLEQLKSLAEKINQPEPFSFADKPQLNKVMQQGNPNEIILQVGTFQMNTGDFFNYLQKALNRAPAPEGWDQDQVQADLAELAYRELFYQALKPADSMVDPELEPTYLTQRNKLWTDQLVKDALLAKALEEQETLRAYYENQKARFQLPPKVRLKILTIPPSEKDPQIMAQLEALLPALSEGTLQLQSLADKFGGSILETEPITAQALAMQDKKIFNFAFQIKQGGFSPPFRRQQGLTVFEVVEKVPPQTQPFSVARKVVAQDYLKHQGQILYKNFAKEKLDAASFNFNKEAAQQHGKVHTP